MKCKALSENEQRSSSLSDSPDLKDCHNGAYKRKNSVKLRKSGVDEGICHHAVSLAFTYDTVCADLTLTDCREKANESDCKTNSEKKRTLSSEIRLEDYEPEEEAHESVETLSCRKCRENHISG